MNFKPLKSTFVLAFLAASTFAGAQITKVKYQLKYNNATSLYDCYLVVSEGSAHSKKERVQMNSQISLVIPATSRLTVEESYNPLVDNVHLSGTKPIVWSIADKVNSPARMSNNDVISISPEINPTGLFNELSLNEEVKLFSFKVAPQPICASDVRLFENFSDPMSDELGMKGGDFRNGYAVGGVAQKYDGNLPLVDLSLPNGEIKSNITVQSGSLALNPGVWKNAKSFSWSGPNGFKSTEKNPILKGAKLVKGIYNVVIANANGCTVTKQVNVDVNSVEADKVIESANNQNSGNRNEVDAKVETVAAIETKIYPNPASEFLNISIKATQGSKVNASIYNAEGKVVMANVINQELSGKSIEKNISLKLTSGIYTAKITVNGVEYDHKFITIE
ncbi:MAG: hypothetical protein RLZZ546_286 [Bacteroidota bacterium]|jgi:hypothetical protein